MYLVMFRHRSLLDLVAGIVEAAVMESVKGQRSTP
jgi:hypothetical protein